MYKRQVTRAAAGEVTGLQRTAVNFGVGSQMQQSYVRGHLASNVGQTSTVTTDAARFSFSQSSSSSDTTQQNFAHALKDALSEQRALTTNYSDSSGWGNSVTLTRATEMDRTSSVSEGTTYKSEGLAHVSANFGDDMPKIGNGPQLIRSPQPSVVMPVFDMAKGQSVVLPPNLNTDGRDPYEMIGGRLNGSLTFKDAQDLVDRATGKIGTQSGETITTDYQTVRSAAENVANNHADERVRSYARGFVQSLDATHSAGRDQTQSNVESMSAVSTLNESDTGSVTTSADTSVPLMNYAVVRYGSGEAALRAMYQPAELASFAGEQHVRAGGSITPADRFGPGTVVSAVERNADVFEAGPANVERAAANNVAKIEEISGTTLNTSTIQDAMSSAPIDGAQQFDAQHGQFVAQHQNSTQAQISRMNFDRGVVLVAREAYNKENQDKNFALRNAFLSGWGYRNGDEIQEDLRAWATSSPALQDRLEKIGASDRDYVSQDDWKSLVEIARQPKGIRLP